MNSNKCEDTPYRASQAERQDIAAPHGSSLSPLHITLALIPGAGVKVPRTRRSLACRLIESRFSALILRIYSIRSDVIELRCAAPLLTALFMFSHFGRKQS